MNEKTISFLAVGLQLLSVGFFGLDVIEDLVEHWTEREPYERSELIHLIFETAAVTALLLGIWMSMRYIKMLQERQAESQQRINALRGEFDVIIQQKFAEWNLTAAERDVAHLTVRGLSIQEICDARGKSPGTIKSQSSAIFRKAGVSSRTELMSLFMDEFLDSQVEQKPVSSEV